MLDGKILKVQPDQTSQITANQTWFAAHVPIYRCFFSAIDLDLSVVDFPWLNASFVQGGAPSYKLVYKPH